MFPQNRVLGLESIDDTTTALLVQGSNDVDDEDTIVLKHADKSAAATHKVERNLIDDAVSAINSDSRTGVTVLFDALNNVKLPNQILANSTVTED
jgi:hydroxypyruvate isomerase